MDIKQISLAIRLADTLHFGQAAELENVAQSGLSAQVAKLELEVGFRIFERTSRRVVLTDAGRLFIERARVLMATMGNTLQECKAVASRNRGVLRIGFFGEGAGELGHHIFNLFRMRNPGIMLSFVELSMANQVQALVSGKVDAAFMRLPVHDSRIEFMPMFDEPRVAVVPSYHDMAQALVLHVRDLEGKTFAVACDGAPKEWASFWSLDSGAHAYGTYPQVSSVPESLATIAYGGAFDTYPLTATRFFTHPGTCYVPLVDAVHSTLALAHFKDNNNPTISLLRQCVVTLLDSFLESMPNVSRSEKSMYQG